MGRSILGMMLLTREIVKLYDGPHDNHLPECSCPGSIFQKADTAWLKLYLGTGYLRLSSQIDHINCAGIAPIDSLDTRALRFS